MTKRWMAALAALALPVGLGAVSPPASADSGPVKQEPAVASPAQPDVARGVVVRVLGASGISGARAAADALGQDVVATRAVTGGASLLLFDKVVPADEARAVAEKLQARPDVLWAEADVRVYPTATPSSPMTRTSPR